MENQHHTNNNTKKPFFGKTQCIVDRIQSLDQKWYVEFWLIRYYFMGIEVYRYKKEKVKLNGKNNEIVKNGSE